MGDSDDDTAHPRQNIERLKLLSETIFTADGWEYPDVSDYFCCAYLNPPSYSADNGVGYRHRLGAKVLWGDLHASWNKESVIALGRSGTGYSPDANYYFIVKQ